MLDGTSHQISTTSGLPERASPSRTKLRSRGRYHQDSTMTVPGIAATSCHIVSEEIPPSLLLLIRPRLISARASLMSSLETTGIFSSSPRSLPRVVLPDPGRPFIKITDSAIVHCDPTLCPDEDSASRATKTTRTAPQMEDPAIRQNGPTRVVPPGGEDCPRSEWWPRPSLH